MVGMPTHKDCINYSNGVCALFNVKVSPEGAACPNFRPKPQEVPEEGYYSRVGYGGSYWYCMRRRMRRRHGWRWR